MVWAPETESASITLVGAFNPSIFHPTWFATNGLLRDDEAKIAQEEGGHLQMLHPYLSSFTADWLTLQVTSDRFSVTASDLTHYNALRDLVLGTFAILEHTGFDKMGLNRDLHFRMESEERWHAVGDALVPKEHYWYPIMKGRPGLRTLLVEGRRYEESSVMLRVKVEPSAKVKPGVYIGTNEHHEGTPRALLESLRDLWEDSQQYAGHVAEHLLSQTLSRPT